LVAENLTHALPCKKGKFLSNIRSCSLASLGKFGLARKPSAYFGKFDQVNVPLMPLPDWKNADCVSFPSTLSSTQQSCEGTRIVIRIDRLANRIDNFTMWNSTALLPWCKCPNQSNHPHTQALPSRVVWKRHGPTPNDNNTTDQ